MDKKKILAAAACAALVIGAGFYYYSSHDDKHSVVLRNAVYELSVNEKNQQSEKHAFTDNMMRSEAYDVLFADSSCLLSAGDIKEVLGFSLGDTMESVKNHFENSEIIDWDKFYEEHLAHRPQKISDAAKQKQEEAEKAKPKYRKFRITAVKDKPLMLNGKEISSAFLSFDESGKLVQVSFSFTISKPEKAKDDTLGVFDALGKPSLVVRRPRSVNESWFGSDVNARAGFMASRRDKNMLDVYFSARTMDYPGSKEMKLVADEDIACFKADKGHVVREFRTRKLISSDKVK